VVRGFGSGGFFSLSVGADRGSARARFARGARRKGGGGGGGGASRPRRRLSRFRVSACVSACVSAPRATLSRSRRYGRQCATTPKAARVAPAARESGDDAQDGSRSASTASPRSRARHEGQWYARRVQGRGSLRSPPVVPSSSAPRERLGLESSANATSRPLPRHAGSLASSQDRCDQRSHRSHPTQSLAAGAAPGEDRASSSSSGLR